MNRQESQQLQKEALKLYLQGIGRDKICEQIGVNHETFGRWKEKGDWEKIYGETKAKVTEKIIQKESIDLEAEKTRSIRLIKAAEAKYAEDIKTQTGLPKSTGMFAQLQKAKWDILLPRTQSQYNFLKQDTINQPSYTLEIVNPNDKHEVATQSKAISGLGNT